MTADRVQVAAARLAVEADRRLGQKPDPYLLGLAGAEPSEATAVPPDLLRELAELKERVRALEDALASQQSRPSGIPRQRANASDSGATTDADLGDTTSGWSMFGSGTARSAVAARPVAPFVALPAPGTEVLDGQGARVGWLGQVYLDEATGAPEWVTVRIGVPGGEEEPLVPVRGASVTDRGALRLPFDRAKVAGAPRVALGEQPGPEKERALYIYYDYKGAANWARLHEAPSTGQVAVIEQVDASTPTEDAGHEVTMEAEDCSEGAHVSGSDRTRGEDAGDHHDRAE